MRTNRLLMATLAAPVLAFALAGCGSGNDAKEIPTAGDSTSSHAASQAGEANTGGSGGQGGAQGEVAAYVDAQRKWVGCMRQNGVDLQDPDAKGQVEMGDVGALKKDPKFLTASEKCADLRVTVPKAVERLLRPKLTPEQVKTQRDYADCMQKNGAPDFPDPGPDGYAEDDNSGKAMWDQNSAGAKQATRACASIIGDPVGTGPGKG
ncbi:hypothetical protein ACE1OC_40360 [Streptomyces sp. DSM 116496]|uniref:hypothetical protein n=1 Tax=Streptomyces stoeckheimensis TaxID=3344656 RepID=UPI0038B345B7